MCNTLYTIQCIGTLSDGGNVKEANLQKWKESVWNKQNPIEAVHYANAIQTRQSVAVQRDGASRLAKYIL